jgi:hypothetical protein
VLQKERLEDGGLGCEMMLRGPGLFLDVWAVRDLSHDNAAHARSRLSTALQSKNGSLLVSSAWVTELHTIHGDARTRARNLLTAFGSNWLPFNPIVSAVEAAEARDDRDAYLSNSFLEGFVRERTGELLRGGTDPHTLADAEFFDLGLTLAWGNDLSSQATQAQALKDAAKTRAEQDRAEQMQDRNSHERRYPRVPFASGPMACVHNAIWREAMRLSPERTWMPNDGFDVVHAIPALTIGGFVAVDTTWKGIGETAALELPPGHARLYRPGELNQLITDLEASA